MSEKVFHFPLSLPPSGVLFYGIYLLTDRVSFHGPHPTSAIVWIDACHRYMAIETQKADVYSECHSLRYA